MRPPESCCASAMPFFIGACREREHFPKPSSWGYDGWCSFVHLLNKADRAERVALAQIDGWKEGRPHHELLDVHLGALQPRLLHDVLARDAHVHVPLPCCCCGAWVAMVAHQTSHQAVRHSVSREGSLLERMQRHGRTDVGGDVSGGEEDERDGQARADGHVHTVRLSRAEGGNRSIDRWMDGWVGLENVCAPQRLCAASPSSSHQRPNKTPSPTSQGLTRRYSSPAPSSSLQTCTFSRPFFGIPKRMLLGCRFEAVGGSMMMVVVVCG